MQPRLFVKVLPGVSQVQLQTRAGGSEQYGFVGEGLAAALGGFEVAAGFVVSKAADGPLPHQAAGFVGGPSGGAQVVGVQGVDVAAFVDADGNRLSIFGGQPHIFPAPCAFAAAVAVFTQQGPAGQAGAVVGVEIALAQGGVGLGSGKQPAEVFLEPVDEAGAEFCLVGQGVFGLGFAFEDALAQGVVLVADFGGFAIFDDAHLGQAATGVVVQVFEAVVDQAAGFVQLVAHLAVEGAGGFAFVLSGGGLCPAQQPVAAGLQLVAFVDALGVVAGFKLAVQVGVAGGGGELAYPVAVGVVAPLAGGGVAAHLHQAASAVVLHLPGDGGGDGLGDCGGGGGGRCAPRGAGGGHDQAGPEFVGEALYAPAGVVAQGEHVAVDESALGVVAAPAAVAAGPAPALGLAQGVVFQVAEPSLHGFVFAGLLQFDAGDAAVGGAFVVNDEAAGVGDLAQLGAAVAVAQAVAAGGAGVVVDGLGFAGDAAQAVSLPLGAAAGVLQGGQLVVGVPAQAGVLAGAEFGAGRCGVGDAGGAAQGVALGGVAVAQAVGLAGGAERTPKASVSGQTCPKSPPGGHCLLFNLKQHRTARGKAQIESG